MTDCGFAQPPGLRDAELHGKTQPDTTSHFSHRRWFQACQASDEPPCPTSPDEGGFMRSASASSEEASSSGRGAAAGQQQHGPGSSSRFKVMSYNILSDQYAVQYSAWLYKDVPPHCLPWEHRLQALMQEILHWSPEIVCMQEVSQYADMERGLKPAGYEGVFVGRPGGRRKDGCATFWKASCFSLLEMHSIDFQSFDLDENVALLVHLKPKQGSETEGEASQRIIVSNTHVCFNPTKGEVKLGQVRTLMVEVRLCPGGVHIGLQPI